MSKPLEVQQKTKELETIVKSAGWNSGQPPKAIADQLYFQNLLFKGCEAINNGKMSDALAIIDELKKKRIYQEVFDGKLTNLFVKLLDIHHRAKFSKEMAHASAEIFEVMRQLPQALGDDLISLAEQKEIARENRPAAVSKPSFFKAPPTDALKGIFARQKTPFEKALQTLVSGWEAVEKQAPAPIPHEKPEGHYQRIKGPGFTNSSS